MSEVLHLVHDLRGGACFEFTLTAGSQSRRKAILHIKQKEVLCSLGVCLRALAVGRQTGRVMDTFIVILSERRRVCSGEQTATAGSSSKTSSVGSCTRLPILAIGSELSEAERGSPLIGMLIDCLGRLAPGAQSQRIGAEREGSEWGRVDVELVSWDMSGESE